MRAPTYVPLLLLAIAKPICGLSRPCCGRRAAVFGAVAASSASVLPATAKDRVTGYPNQYDWEKTLAPGPFFVLRQGGTEPPNSSPLVKEKRAGSFGCGLARRLTLRFRRQVREQVGLVRLWARGRRNCGVVHRWAAGQRTVVLRLRRHLGDAFNDGYLFWTPPRKRASASASTAQLWFSPLTAANPSRAMV